LPNFLYFPPFSKSSGSSLFGIKGY
jgi:hypothetical protein